MADFLSANACCTSEFLHHPLLVHDRSLAPLTKRRHMEISSFYLRASVSPEEYPEGRNPSRERRAWSHPEYPLCDRNIRVLPHGPRLAHFRQNFLQRSSQPFDGPGALGWLAGPMSKEPPQRLSHRAPAVNSPHASRVISYRQTGGRHSLEDLAHHSPLRPVDLTLEDFAKPKTALDEFDVPSTINRMAVATLLKTS